MLLKMRGGLDSIFVTILLGLLIAAFAIFGIGPGMLAGSNQSVARVGDTEIPTNRFATQVQRQAQEMQLQFGGSFSTPQLIQMLSIDQQVLNRMIADAAIEEHTTGLGLRATDQQVAAELNSIDAFKLFGGGFSAESLDLALQNAGVTRNELLADLANGIERRQLLESFISQDLVSADMAEQLHVWQGERRTAALVNISASDVTDIPTPTDGELAEYFETNMSAYMTPERRSYQYLLLTPDYLAERVEIPDGRIRELYDERADDYAGSETRNLLQVNFDTEGEASAFAAAVRLSSDFYGSVELMTDFTREEVGLGDLSRRDVAQQFNDAAADTVFALEVNTPSEPFEDLGLWNVFFVTDVTTTEGRTFEDVAAEIEENYRTEEAIELMYDYIDAIDTAMEETSDLVDIAARAGLDLATVSMVDAQGRTTSGAQAVTSQNEFTIQSAVFRETIDVEPTLTDLNPTDATVGSYLFQITEIVDPQEQQLETVRGDVTTALMTERLQSRAGEIAEQVTERLQAGDSAEIIAEELGGTSFEAKNVARTGDASSGLSQNIRQLIFDLAVGETGSEASADGDGYVVARVLEARPGDPVTGSGQVNALIDELNAGFENELFQQYEAYLRSRYDVSVNNALIQQLFTADTLQ